MKKFNLFIVLVSFLLISCNYSKEITNIDNTNINENVTVENNRDENKTNTEYKIEIQKQGKFKGLVPSDYDLDELVGTYDNFILDEKLALEIGIAVLHKVYGEEKLIDATFIVKEIDGKEYFTVALLPISDSGEMYLGGDYNVAISKIDGKILKIWMGE